MCKLGDPKKTGGFLSRCLFDIFKSEQDKAYDQCNDCLDKDDSLQDVALLSKIHLYKDPNQQGKTG